MNRSILILSFILVLGASFRCLNLQYFHGLDTDEAIYAQIAFAVTKGNMLYKEVGFVHPPLYPVLEYPFVLISPTLVTLRLFNVALSLAVVVLIFYLCKTVYSVKVALVASAIYALYPLVIYSNKLALLENSLTFFVTLMFLLFAKFVKEKNVNYLYLAGFIAGVALMTKFTALLFIAPLVLFAIVRVFRKKIKPLFMSVFFAAALPLTVALVLIVSGAWPYFFMQAVGWQTIRFGLPLSEKFYFFGMILASMLPLLLVAAFSFRRNLGDWRGEMVMVWFFVPLFLLAVSRIVFLHYGFSLMPPIVILASLSIDHYVLDKFRHPVFNFSFFKKVSAFLLGTVLILIVIGGFINVPYGIRWFFVENVVGVRSEGEYMQFQLQVAAFIQNVTVPTDKVWSSDASFGFLSQRLLVVPNQEYWRFQGFFQDVWGYGWTPDDYRGPIPGYSTGLFSLQDIQRAWEIEKPKVILIINSSWVDYFVWNGINNNYHKETGLADYVRSNYELKSIFASNSFARNAKIEVWILKLNLDNEV